jgi:hypothetical protein
MEASKVWDFNFDAESGLDFNSGFEEISCRQERGTDGEESGRIRVLTIQSVVSLLTTRTVLVLRVPARTSTVVSSLDNMTLTEVQLHRKKMRSKDPTTDDSFMRQKRQRDQGSSTVERHAMEKEECAKPTKET